MGLLQAGPTKGNEMKWLETINIRAARVTDAAKVIELCRQSLQSTAVEKLLKLTVYCSARYATDISMHLEWECDPGSVSVLGRGLSAALGDLGLISHTVWAVQEEFPAGISENPRTQLQCPLTGPEQRKGNLSHSLMLLSHDLRAMFLSLAAGLDLVVRGKFGSVDERIAKRLIGLRSQAVRLNGIAEDYLAGATIDASGEIRKETLDLREGVIDPVLEEFADLIRSRGITIEEGERTVSAGAFTVQASGRLLRSVYRNLLSNAIRYGAEGTVVSFGCEDQGRQYRLSVFNSGQPVSEELRDKLFTRFGLVGETANNSSYGTGLGLYLVREIIRKHGGEIWYEPARNGSNFVFTIPKELQDPARASYSQ